MRKTLLIILGLALAATAADDIAGEYTCFGTDARTGRMYGYEVEINKTGDVYKIQWFYEGEPLYDGVGVVMNGRLCVGYASPVGYGAAVYKIEPGGVLNGLWGIPGTRDKGKEKLYKD